MGFVRNYAGQTLNSDKALQLRGQSWAHGLGGERPAPAGDLCLHNGTESLWHDMHQSGAAEHDASTDLHRDARTTRIR